MHRLGSFLLLRLVAVLAAGVAPLPVAAWLGPHLSSLGQGPFTATVLTGAHVGLWLVATWWAALSVTAVHDTLAGTRGHRWEWGPRSIRRALLAACGAGLVAGASLAPAQAAGAPGSPLPSPERPVGAAPAARPSVHVVRTGESLWSIAEKVGSAGDPAGTARTTERIYHLNRARIGKDPDLLLPGTRLRLPGSTNINAQEPADIRKVYQ